MTDEQRSLAGYKSNIHEQEDFEDQNAGKPILDDVTEYVFSLASYPDRPNPRVRGFKQVKENKKTGEKKTIDVDKAICEFVEKNTRNVVVAFFRVDTLNFSDKDEFESGVVRFFKKLKHPLREGVQPNWEEYFIPGMRFRGRVVVKTKADKDGNTVRSYYLDIPTCRPLLPSDKAGEDFAREPAPQTTVSDGTLANALLLAKGAKDFNSAMDMLKAANASNDVAMALFNANLDNKIVYPI